MRDDGDDWSAYCWRSCCRPLCNCTIGCAVVTFFFGLLVFIFMMALILYRLLRGEDMIWGRAVTETILVGTVIALAAGVMGLVLLLCCCGRGNSGGRRPPVVSTGRPTYRSTAVADVPPRRQTVIRYQ